MQSKSPQQRYHDAHRKNVTIAFILPNEQEVYDYLRTVDNKAGYIKGLIKKDMIRSAQSSAQQ